MADSSMTMLMLWLLLAAVAAIIYLLKKVFNMEKYILITDRKIDYVVRRIQKEELDELRELQKIENSMERRTAKKPPVKKGKRR